MEIILNNTVRKINTNLSIQQLLNEELLVEDSLRSLKGIAVAINQTVIAKNEWDIVFLKQNDDVLIIKPMQGG